MTSPSKQAVLDDIFFMIQKMEELSKAEMRDVLSLYLGDITYEGLLGRYGRKKADWIVQYLAMCACALFGIYSLSQESQDKPLT